jgi:hypothetical protein
MNHEATPDATPTTWILVPSAAVLLSLVAAIVSLAILSLTFPFFLMPILPEQGLSPSVELLNRYMVAQIDYRTHNYMLAFAIVGAILGACLGLGTPSKKRIQAAIASSLATAIGGALAAYLVSGAVARALENATDQSLLQSGSLHFALWGAMGACIGFTLGLVHRGIVPAIIGALIGMLSGLLVSAVWNILASIVFSNTNLIHLFPETTTERVVWAGVCFVVLGLGISMGFKPTPEKDKAEAESTTP